MQRLGDRRVTGFATGMSITEGAGLFSWLETWMRLSTSMALWYEGLVFSVNL
jgi:hypothetical protein